MLPSHPLNCIHTNGRRAWGSHSQGEVWPGSWGASPGREDARTRQPRWAPPSPPASLTQEPMPWPLDSQEHLSHPRRCPSSALSCPTLRSSWPASLQSVPSASFLSPSPSAAVCSPLNYDKCVPSFSQPPAPPPSNPHSQDSPRTFPIVSPEAVQVDSGAQWLTGESCGVLQREQEHRGHAGIRGVHFCHPSTQSNIWHRLCKHMTKGLQ